MTPNRVMSNRSSSAPSVCPSSRKSSSSSWRLVGSARALNTVSTAEKIGDQMVTCQRCPAVVDVGGALLVVAVGLGHGHEAVPFVEAAGPGVRLEGPQVEPLGSADLRVVEQGRADAPPGLPGLEVQVVDPRTVEHEQPDDHAVLLGHPRLGVRQHGGGEVVADVVVGVHRRRDRRHRGVPRPQVHVCDRASVISSGRP